MTRRIAPEAKTADSGNGLNPPLPGALKGLRKALLKWFRLGHRDMPWRRSKDPYAIWVSEIMLQQTQVATATPYFERFMEQLPTVRDLAEAPLETVLSLWAGLGYYSRARNLQKAAQLIMQEHGGCFPREYDVVRALPGIGDYTAGAVLSIAFGQPVPAVDGNVERVLCRVFEIEGAPRKAPARGLIRQIAQSVAQCDQPGDVNQALMELGATVCKPAGPECAGCPVTDLCAARKSGRQELFPQTPPRAKSVKVRTVAAIVRRDGHVLVAQRPENAVWAGLWEFPQGEVREGKAEAVLARYVRDHTGLELSVGSQALRIRHGVMNRSITLDVYECELRGGNLTVDDYAQVRWVGLDELAQLPFSSPHRKIVAYLTDTEGRLAL